MDEATREALLGIRLELERLNDAVQRAADDHESRIRSLERQAFKLIGACSGASFVVVVVWNLLTKLL